MSEKSLTEQIRHYQKDIERCPDNTERMMRCIKRLYMMPIKVEHLQETGVGRSVNGLRKYDGQVGDAATALVSKWKKMVAAEDSECEQEVDECVDDEVITNENRCNGDTSLKVSEHPVKDKENIRHNHSDRNQENEKSKKSKHSSNHEKEHLSRKESSSKSRSHHESEPVINKSVEKVSKEKLSDKHSKSSDKDSKKSEKKHSSKSDIESHSSKSKHKSTSKDKNESSRHHKDTKKDSKNSYKSKEHSSGSGSKHSRKDKKSDSEIDVKHEKRKHSSQIKSEKSPKRLKYIKQEQISEDEEEFQKSDSGDSRDASECSDVDNGSPSLGRAESMSSVAGDDSEDERSSASEPERRVKIKKEPSSDEESSDHSSHKESRRGHSGQHKEKHKSEKKHHHSSHKSSKKESSKHMSKSDLKLLIAENEKKIKKEKLEAEENPTKSKNIKKVKVETNQDGSIDSGSGASFADALRGLDTVKGSKKKKVKTVSSSPSKISDSFHSPSQSSPTRSSSSSPTKTVKHTLDLMKEPELLTKRPKLESLQLDISSTLPEINPNYKPLPYLPVKTRRTSSTAFDEEAMFNSMTTKNQRTKVYSGSKVGHYGTVLSLYSFCIQVLYDNIEGLEYTGGVPYEILKPLLEKLNAEQLLNLEHYNPYLVEDTDKLWSFHCKKDFRLAQRDEDESWRELYLRCMDEREVKLKRLTANITESMAKSTPVRQAKLAYVDTVAKPPRNVARKQAKYGTGGSVSSSSSGVASTSNSSSANLAAAASNAAKKKEIVSKAVVGGFTPASPATDVVTFNNPATASKLLKKKKAPLMAKALQLIKSNSRYKR